MSLDLLREAIVACRACPRLVEHRERVALEKRRAFRDETYWGRPVPGFGDPAAALVIVGLAPAAHGANRTGRVFTGDRSGDFLYAALHRAGLASCAESRSRDDGLRLSGVYITIPCRCAPPDNKPAPDELARCAAFFQQEIDLLPRARVYLALGKIGHEALVALARRRHPSNDGPRRTTLRVPFAHGASAAIPDPRGGARPVRLFASYHVSQQNTQTGRLTPAMFDQVLRAAAEAAGLPLRA